MEAEIIAPEPSQEHSEFRWKKVGVLGPFAAVLAVLTILAAFGFGFLAIFATTLVMAAATTLLWPLIFSPEFTQWVFGTPQIQFWKLFLLFLATGTILKLFRPFFGKGSGGLWQRK